MTSRNNRKNTVPWNNFLVRFIDRPSSFLFESKERKEALVSIYNTSRIYSRLSPCTSTQPAVAGLTWITTNYEQEQQEEYRTTIKSLQPYNITKPLPSHSLSGISFFFVFHVCGLSKTKIKK